MIQDLVLVGGGGHCESCTDVIEGAGGFRIAGIVDRREKIGDKVCGYPIIGSDDDLPVLTREYKMFLITVGQIKTADPRLRLFKRLQDLGARFPTITASTAHVARTASIGDGSIVMHYALINSNTHVGLNCIINTKALIEHGVRIGDHCHIATAAVVNGNATVEEETFIGSGAIIREGIKIGARSVIGCHATVIKQLAPQSYKIGSSRRIIRGKTRPDK